MLKCTESNRSGRWIKEAITLHARQEQDKSMNLDTMRPTNFLILMTNCSLWWRHLANRSKGKKMLPKRQQLNK